MYELISTNIFNCKSCPTRCDNVSKGVYNFKNDSEFSEQFENKIINKINSIKNYTASKCVVKEYPDIKIVKKDKSEIYLEVKVQQRTFMQIEQILPLSKLKPSETVALNLSDLLRYFEIINLKKVKIYIVWVLANRLCMVPAEQHLLFYQDAEILQDIYQKEKDKRRFRRKSGKGDVVDGVHKGVTVNYHFSINELNLWENFNL